MLYLSLLLILILSLSTPSLAEDTPSFFLRLERSKTREVLLDLPVTPGDPFSLRYIHSSDKTPVHDTFLIEKEGQLVLIEEAFLWYGAGLESQKHDGMEIVYDGQWTRVRLRRSFPELNIRVGRVANQILEFRNRSVPLNALVEPGENLHLSVITKWRENGH